MTKIDILSSLYKSPQTIFSLKELSLVFSSLKYTNLKRRLNNLVKRGRLLNPARGIYTKDNYSVFELAEKLYSPAYISLESVLTREGVIFQKYESVFAISYVNRELKVGDNKIIYRRMKNEILLNSLGIEKVNNYFIATKERAFTDAVYLYKDYYFDNLTVLNWDLVFDLAKIYKSKVTLKRIMDYYKLNKKNHV